MDNEEIQGVKFSEFPSATPGNSDEVVGLHARNNVRFSVANFILAIRQGLTNLFVPLTRTVNNKALSSDITLTASDVGAYEMPSGGIPKSDLAQGVQDSLDDADSAYQMPSGGIPSTDMDSAVQTSLGLADTAYQLPSGGIPSSDMASAVQTSLGKADTAYQKPSAGIPSSDMTSAVQTSLGKADSAYQKPSSGIPASDLASGVIPTVPSISTSTPNMDGTAAAGSTGQVSDAGHVHPTDTSRVPVYGMGENLLDNWYFVGGGSGRGIFPINQRGLATYPTGSDAYTIDRWYGSGTGTLDVFSDCIKITGTHANYGKLLRQGISNPKNLIGKIVTFSALVIQTAGTYTANNEILIEAKTGMNQGGYAIGSTPCQYSGLYSLTVEVPDFITQGYSYLTVGFGTGKASSMNIAAAKLELGTEQTLAHQENSAWVLNEIPDYGEELIKCQTSTADPSDTYANKTLATTQQLSTLGTYDVLLSDIQSLVSVPNPHTVPSLSQYRYLMVTMDYKLGSTDRNVIVNNVLPMSLFTSGVGCQVEFYDGSARHYFVIKHFSNTQLSISSPTNITGNFTGYVFGIR